MIRQKVVIQSVSYRSADNWACFVVKSVSTGKEKNCTGVLPEIVDYDDMVTIEGKLVNDKRYGEQIQCSAVFPEPPDTESKIGICKFLTKLRGVGEVSAGKFYDKCRKEGLEGRAIVDHALTDVCAVGVKPIIKDEETNKLTLILGGYEHIIYLLGIGLTSKQATKLFSAFGDETTAIVSENPYQIISVVDGIGFLSCDKIAFKAGISCDNTSRTQACIRYCLNDSVINGGNTKLRGWELTGLVADQLRESAIKCLAGELEKLPGKNEIRSEIYKLQEVGVVLVEGAFVYDAHLRSCEESIMEALTEGFK